MKYVLWLSLVISLFIMVTMSCITLHPSVINKARNFSIGALCVCIGASAGLIFTRLKK